MERAEQVGKLHLQGKSPTQIARELDLKRSEVNKSLEDFRALLRQGSETAADVHDRIMDIIFEADAAFRMVVEHSWGTVEQADSGGQLNAKTNALKLIESATKNRADMLQKAGVSQDDEIIEQLNESERRQEVLIELLKEIRTDYPEVAELIAKRLSQIQSEVESIEVIGGDDD